jgi:hypothetical protein
LLLCARVVVAFVLEWVRALVVQRAPVMPKLCRSLWWSCRRTSM